MVLVTGLNTWADFGLCFGGYGLPRLGYMGLAWATLLSVCGGCLFNTLVLVWRGWLRLASFPPLRWIRKALPYLWRVAWPAGLMQVLWHTGYLVLFAITASLPREEVVALAAFAAGIRMESLLFLPAMAFNMTASILVGHYLGAKDVSGARSMGLRIWASGCVLISLLGAVLWVFVPDLAQLLSQRPEVEAEIVNYLHFNILAIPFTGTTMILGGVFIGAGATRFNMFAIGGTVWLVRLPLAYILGHLTLASATGIWAAMLISQMVQATLMFLLFSYKDWYRFSMQSQKVQPQAAGA
jgi:putative MATE family efflux protein